MAYEIDYNDKRLVEVTNNKTEALNKSDTAYNEAIAGTDRTYNEAIDKLAQSQEQQKAEINKQTDFAIEQINQQKDQTKKDYIKEQSGAYVDWQKEKDSYGANAEQRAAAGLAGAGYSESAQVSIYNTYQNRVATARDAYGRAVLNYDNAIKDARLKNSSLLAEIAKETLQQQLELSLQAFQYKNTLVLEKANKRLEIENMYHSQYMNVLNQINQENRLAEEVRQYNETLAFQKDQAAKEQAYKNAALQLERDKFNYQKSQDAAAAAAASAKAKKAQQEKNKKAASKSRSSGSARKAYANRGFTGTTYNAAVEYMKKNGVDGGYASNVMTKGEFARAKASGGRRGDAGNYATYTDYLKAFVNHAVNS